jgi:very-short-patch-repair endonuclease
MPTNPPADGPKTDVYRRESARRRSRGRDGLIAQLAERQHGVVAIGQLLDLGIEERAVHRRAEAGSLHRIHQGVYAAGHPALTVEGRWMASVLACGSEAALSHRSAAALWKLYPERPGSIDVTAPKRRGRIPKGIAAHRHGSLSPDDRTMVCGIPCTTVTRTLLDFAGVAPVWELRKAISEAEVLGLLDVIAMRKLIRRSRGRRGVARLRLILEELDPETKRTRSELERRFLRMCKRAGLPPPEVNASLEVDDGRLEPDFLWRDAGLIVEADGRRYHDTGSAFQLDRRREQRLQLAGWRVSRCTWTQVISEPRELAATIRGLLTNPRRRA